MALPPHAAFGRRPAMEAAAALPVNRGFVARQSPQRWGSAAASGELVVEKAAHEADPGERQDAPGDAVEPDQVRLAEGVAEQAGAEADADPPDQGANQHPGDEHGRAPECCLLAGKADAGKDAEEGKDGE